MPAHSEAKMHLIQETRARTPRTLIVTVQPQLRSDAEQESSVSELMRLARTLGLDVVGTQSQKRTTPSPSTYVGPGRLKEIAALTGGPGTIPSYGGSGGEEKDENDVYLNDIEPLDVDLVLVNDTLGPRLHRALEHAFGKEVLDRTGLILEIFEQRARTREAKLEIEIARLNYELPRLRDSRSMRRREGGGGGRGGQGDTVIALGKERIRERIAQLEAELEMVRRTFRARKKQRKEEVYLVALVGYTNAGKSSLMRGMSGSEVLVEDKLFATLGTTARQLEPPASPPVVLSDTVGFIQDLPHELVASFRSTLEEAADADLILLVLDASDPNWREHLEVTRETLGTIDVDERRVRIVFNKCDALEERARLSLRALWPRAIQTSAHEGEALLALREQILDVQARGLCEEHMLLPYTRGELRAEIFSQARVLEEEHSEWGTRFTLAASEGNLDRWRSMLNEALGGGDGEDLTPDTILEYAWHHGIELLSDQAEVERTGDGGMLLSATDITGARWDLRVPANASQVAGHRRAARAIALLRDRLEVALPHHALQTSVLLAAPSPTAPVFSPQPGTLPAASMLRAIGAFLASLQKIEEQDALEARLPIMSIDEVRAWRRHAVDATREVLEPTRAQLERWRIWLEQEDNWPKHTALVHGSFMPAHLYGESDLAYVGGFERAGWRDPSEDLATLAMHLDQDTFDAVLNTFHGAGGELWQGFDRHIEELRAFMPVIVAMEAIEQSLGDEAIANARTMLDSVMA